MESMLEMGLCFDVSNVSVFTRFTRCLSADAVHLLTR